MAKKTETTVKLQDLTARGENIMNIILQNQRISYALMLTIYTNYAPQINHYAQEICHYAFKQNKILCSEKHLNSRIPSVTA